MGVNIPRDQWVIELQSSAKNLGVLPASHVRNQSVVVSDSLAQLQSCIGFRSLRRIESRIVRPIHLKPRGAQQKNHHGVIGPIVAGQPSIQDCQPASPGAVVSPILGREFLMKRSLYGAEGNLMRVGTVMNRGRK